MYRYYMIILYTSLIYLINNEYVCVIDIIKLMFVKYYKSVKRDF